MSLFVKNAPQNPVGDLSDERPNHSSEDAVGLGASAPLGINTVTVDSDRAARARIEARRELYADLRTASIILKTRVKKNHRTGKCRWCAISSEVELTLTDHGGEKRAAAFRGVAVCGGVWTCPVCAAVISRRRRDEMNVLLAWARAEGLVPVLLTLTARHGRADGLVELLGRMKEAKRRLRQRAEWRRLPLEGSVTATEITHGQANGWHPHFHELVLLRAASEAEALAMVAPLGDAWRASLRAFGLDGAEAAFEAQGAGAAGNYVAKWGAAEELTLSDAKRGGSARRDRRGRLIEPGRTPRELLREVADAMAEGDERRAERHRQLWLEYVAATSGKRRAQLQWTPTLKDRSGVKDVSDQDAAEDSTGAEPAPVLSWDNREWRHVRIRRVRVLEAAEKGGVEAARRAVSGPPDPVSVGPPPDVIE